jgi:hypothetical protein
MNNTTAIVQSIVFSSIPFLKSAPLLQAANNESNPIPGLTLSAIGSILADDAE